MTFLPKFDPNIPTCEKHQYQGYQCPQCFNEKYHLVDREHYLASMHVLKTMLEKVGLTAGVEVADKLIKEATLKPC